MSKTNFLPKYLKNISNSINSLLEKNLNKLNFNNFRYLLINNKIILTIVAVIVMFISYLLLPTFYKQFDISNELKTKLQNKLDLDLKFSQSLKYNFFPKPHFETNQVVIFYDNKEISKIDKIKIFISLDNLFSSKNIKVKDIIFENANFNLNKKNFDIFNFLLNKNFKDGDLTIKDSNIFFRNFENEVLFINKILKMKYFYDSKKLKNVFNVDSEIFNIPFSMLSSFNKDRDKIFSTINLGFAKLKIENELNLNDEKIGRTELIFNKLKRIAEYKIKKNYFEFHIYDKSDEPSVNYKGEFNFKPFHADVKGDLNEINLNYLFGYNAIIAQLLKTEILNSKNIDFKLNINADRIYDNLNFKNIKLKSKIQEGLIDTDNTKFEWDNFADFEILESLIFVRNGELILDGRLKININNYSELYKYLLTPKNYRDKISKIDLNFVFNFDKKIAELKDIKIDNKINQNVNEILSNLILKKDKFQNKIYFKNLLNEAIKSYAG